MSRRADEAQCPHFDPYGNQEECPATGMVTLGGSFTPGYTSDGRRGTEKCGRFEEWNPQLPEDQVREYCRSGFRGCIIS